MSVNENYKSMIQRFFERADKKFDQSCGLIGEKVTEKNVIHTNVTGYAHHVRDNAIYAQLVYMTKSNHRYAAAEEIINKIIDAQDKNENSSTYGLWSYYFEEKITEMSAPDYNMAEFIARPMIYVILEKSKLISPDTRDSIKSALRRAAKCCMKRNVGHDYTNVAAMSCVTVIIVGEILNDAHMINYGKEKLRGFVKYTEYTGGFSEYNSPCYFKYVGDSMARMLRYCKDAECIEMAENIGNCLWNMVSMHYSNVFKELAPPYVRAYNDLDADFENSDYIYYATSGKYGEYHCSANDWELNILDCPEAYFNNFEKEIWIEDEYYKTNNLREKNSDATIIQDFDSPNLTAYTLKRKDYLFGALQKTDLWDQRRTSMLLWDKHDKKTFKLRCEKDGYSFSSAMAYTAMYKNEQITVVSFATDHGEKHYILDKLKDGIINTESLKFTMKICGNYEKNNLRKTGNGIVYTDANISFDVKIISWVFNGKDGIINFTEDGFELVCYNGEPKEIDLNGLDDTYGVISIKVNGAAPNVKIEVADGRLTASTKKFKIDTYSKPNKYNLCMKNTGVKTISKLDRNNFKNSIVGSI